MKYYFLLALVVIGCSGEDKPSAELLYRAETDHVIVEGRSKTDAATAKAAGAVNQMVLESVDKH